MTATVHDLITARATRGRPPLHFDTDLEALAYIANELDEARAEAVATLLLPAEPVAARLERVRAVVAALDELYRHDERNTQ
jgi:hypothetical protein